MAVNVKKTTVVTLVDSNNEEINIEDLMLFEAEGRVLIGRFKGIANRGALVFKGIKEFSDVEFHVMPKSINKIYHYTMGE